MARACSTVGGQGSFCSVPQTLMPVRSASIGAAVAGRRRSACSTAAGRGAQARCAVRGHSPVQSSSATCAYVP